MTHRPGTTVTNAIPENLSFVFLDDSVTEYVNFKDKFCGQTNCNANSWFRCKNVEEFQIYFSRITLPNKIVLITSGSLCSDAIKDVHNKDELHSVYIYCLSIPTYEPLKKQYSKIGGVFDIPDTLLINLRNSLEEEMIRLQLNGSLAISGRQRPNRSQLTLAERGRFESMFLNKFLIH